jgi:imidazolonepropionase-like amidohydrolase
MSEVRALTLDGLPAEAILRMAASDAAAALGTRDRAGTIEPGRLADLVLLDDDPVSDIETLRRVELVMKEGRIVYRRDPNAKKVQ